MSTPSPVDPRQEKSAMADENLCAVHDQPNAGKSGAAGHYHLLPLALLFVFSGLIFYAGSYLNRYSGHFSSRVFDERQLPTSGAAVAAKIDPLVLGKKQYGLACITCHMPNGLGLPGVYPPLAGSEWVLGSEDRLASIVLHGLKGPITVKGNVYGTAAMPAFGQVPGSGYNWNDEKIAAVLTYIRHEWGNAATPVTAEKVAEMRTKGGSRKEWSEAELLALP